MNKIYRKKDQHKTLQKKQEKKERERTENQFLEIGFLFAKKLGKKKKTETP